MTGWESSSSTAQVTERRPPPVDSAPCLAALLVNSWIAIASDKPAPGGQDDDWALR